MSYTGGTGYGFGQVETPKLPSETEITRLMHDFATKAYEAKEAGDLDTHAYYKRLIEIVGRLRSGAYTSADLLEIERARRREAQLKGVVGGIAGAALLPLLALGALMLLRR